MADDAKNTGMSCTTMAKTCLDQVHDRAFDLGSDLAQKANQFISTPHFVENTPVTKFDEIFTQEWGYVLTHMPYSSTMGRFSIYSVESNGQFTFWSDLFNSKSSQNRL